MTFGEKLRYLIERRDLTQTKFAEMLSVSLSTLNSYVNDKRLPNLLIVATMAKQLHVTTDYLLGCESDTSSIPLSDEELRLLGNLRALDEEKRSILFRLAEMLNNK